MLNATVTAQSRLQTPEQFRNIIVKADPSGARVLLGDVARVELGAENYSPSSASTAIPAPASAFRWRRAPTRSRPPTWSRPRSSRSPSACRRLSIRLRQRHDRLHQAVDRRGGEDPDRGDVLVVLVMFVFLQSWRATLIPFIAIPVVLLGTFASLYALGFSINTMTLFGLVLASACWSTTRSSWSRMSSAARRKSGA
jgi:multidrug efflux pump